jgi:hypothetical protein
MSDYFIVFQQRSWRLARDTAMEYANTITLDIVFRGQAGGFRIFGDGIENGGMVDFQV